MRKPLEKDVQRLLLDWLKLHGVLCWRQNQGAITASYNGKSRFLRFASMPGISDIIGLLPRSGRFLAVEVKRPGNKPTPEQEQFIASVKAAGGVAGVCCCLRDLEQLLEREGALPC